MKQIFNIYSIPKLVLYVFLFTFSYLCSAKCYMDGQPVPEGSRIGIMVCKDNKWVAVNEIPPVSGEKYMKLKT